METVLSVRFSSAVRHAKASIGGDDLVLKSKQVKGALSARAKTASCGSLLAMARVFVSSFYRFSLTINVVGLVL